MEYELLYAPSTQIFPVTKPELQDLIKNKGVNYVDSKSGFTKPAVDYRNHYHKEVTLESRGRKI